MKFKFTIGANFVFKVEHNESDIKDEFFIEQLTKEDIKKLINMEEVIVEIKNSMFKDEKLFFSITLDEDVCVNSLCLEETEIELYLHVYQTN